LAYLKDKINVYDDKGTHTERLLKMAVVDFDCRMENMECLNTMSALFNSIPKSYFRDPNNQPNPYLHRKKNLSIFFIPFMSFFSRVLPNHRALAYKYHIENTYNISDWFDLGTFYTRTNNLEERNYAIDALANTRLNFIFDL
jgi:hypothetical protein